ncbi:MAG: hypothetical protein ACRDK9_03940 [Solirubrobacterales bacterium]
MAARRLVIVMLVLLFVSTLAAALVPPPETDDPETRRTTETTEGPRGRQISRTLDAGAAQPQTIRLKIGDQLALTVRSPRPVQVELAGLGQLEDVDPASPARFNLFPSEPGEHAVRLLGSGRVIGRIVIGERTGEVSESRRRAGRSAGTSRSR